MLLTKAPAHKEVRLQAEIRLTVTSGRRSTIDRAALRCQKLSVQLHEPGGKRGGADYSHNPPWHRPTGSKLLKLPLPPLGGTMVLGLK